jgi:erythromycin esterase
MAENVKWLANEAFPNEKIVLWAHNAHVATSPHMALLSMTMGQHLRQTFGEQMRVLGFAFDHGEFRSVPLGQDASRGPIPIRVPRSNSNRAEALLRAAGLPRFILDLHAVPAASPLGTWLAGPQTLRAIGGAYTSEDDLTAYGTSVLPEAFDALVFIEESTASVPLN